MAEVCQDVVSGTNALYPEEQHRINRRFSCRNSQFANFCKPFSRLRIIANPFLWRVRFFVLYLHYDSEHDDHIDPTRAVSDRAVYRNLRGIVRGSRAEQSKENPSSGGTIK